MINAHALTSARPERALRLVHADPLLVYHRNPVAPPTCSATQQPSPSALPHLFMLQELFEEYFSALRRPGTPYKTFRIKVRTRVAVPGAHARGIERAPDITKDLCCALQACRHGLKGLVGSHLPPSMSF